MNCTFAMVSGGGGLGGADGHWQSHVGGSSLGRAAIAIVQLEGDVDAALSRLLIAPVVPGGAVLRTIPDVDTLVVARLSATCVLLFPHAGPAVLRRLDRSLRGVGCVPTRAMAPAWNGGAENASLHTRLWEALARAKSPLAIDVLLAQPRRWATEKTNGRLSDAEAACLRRLIDPPLVVALGPPNIGKSSLLNALAGRGVSIVDDAAGTTRDHVGVSLDLGGLVVRYVDTPGMDGSGDAIQREVQQAALEVAARADLALMCVDAGSRMVAVPTGVQALSVGLRSDLGRPAEAVDVLVSVVSGEGLGALVDAIRERLVPARLMSDQRAWAFWA